MIRKLFAGMAALVVAASLLMLGTDVASGAPAVGQVASTASSTSDDVFADCYYYKDGVRGCSYLNTTKGLFRVCDKFKDGRYTTGRVAVNGEIVQVFWVRTDNTCSEAANVYYRRLQNDVVCIHTGVEGLGWTTAECWHS